MLWVLLKWKLIVDTKTLSIDINAIYLGYIYVW